MAPLNIRNGNRQRRAVIGFMSVAFVVPTVYMLMDRDPPFTRVGKVVPADPKHCELPPNMPHVPPSRQLLPADAIRAGSCVEVIWDIVVKRNCPQAGPDNVVRHIRDSTGILRSIGSLRGLYGRLGDVPTSGIRNFFVLPSPMPLGPATYSASACYACNPLQHLVWPICVDQPDITFEVVE